MENVKKTYGSLSVIGLMTSLVTAASAVVTSNYCKQCKENVFSLDPHLNFF